MRGKKLWQRLLAFALSLLIIAGTLSGLDFKPKKVQAADATDFRNLVEAVTIDIDGQTVTGDEWKPIYPEVEYTLHLTASETINNADRQFNNTEITYTLPDGFDAKNVNTTITARIVDEKGTLILSGNTYVINNNQIGIVWNQTSAEDYQRLVNCGNATVTLDISGTFNAECRELDFGNGVVKTVTVSNDSNVSAEKSSYYNMDTGRIEYTVTVRSSGHNNNVAITDVVSGTLLTFDPSSVVVSSNKTESVSYSGSTNASGFDFVVPSMVSGEVITVKYSAIVDVESSTGVDGMLTAGETQNTVTVVSDEDANNDDNTKTTTNNIRFSSISKEGIAGEDYEEGGKKYRNIAWTIYANEEAIQSIAGTTISDSLISAGTAASAVYSGDGITVDVYDRSHDLVRSDAILWGNLTASTDSGFTYTVPDGDSALSYEIHYTTKVELTGLSSPTTVKNSAEFKYGTSEQSVGIAPAAGNELGVSKVATNISSEKIDWEIYVHVPEDGINELVVKDELSNIWIHKDDQHKLVYDAIDFDSITVSGITGTESFDYTAQLDSTSGTPSGLTFTFYQAPGVPGIAGSESGRDFVISFSTLVDKDWFELYGGNAWSGNHYNTVKVNDQITATADAIPTEKTLDKIGTLINTVDDNGTELPVYRYDVIISGLDRESFDITDTFDTEHLELVDEIRLNEWSVLDLDNIFLRGDPTVENLTKENDTTSGYGQRTYNGTSGSQALSYNTTDTGVVFHVNTDNIPKTGGTYYPHYAITYYLKVKDAAALAELDQLAHENSNACYTFTNTAKALGMTASEDINYSASGLLSKEILNLDELGTIDPVSGQQIRDAEFKIVFNADGDTWNNGNTIELLDSYTNMSVDFTSIHVEDGAGNDITDEVSYDARSYTITFKVPDNKKIVITYKARINGSSDVTFSNELSYKGSKVETRETKNFSSSEEAQASNFYVTLFKYETGDMTKPLEGAVFELYDAATDEPITIKKEGPDYGKNITFKTGADGSVQIKGDQSAWGWSLEGNKEYYLKEIKAPTGYKLRERNLSFSVTQGDPDYDNFVYFIGDVLTCRNTPDDSGTGKITVNKTYTSASTTARTFTFGLFTDAEGTTRAVDANSNPIELQSVSITGTGSGTTVTDNTDTVEFTGVPYGTYYVFEVDSEGNALVSDVELPYYISGNGAQAVISEASAEAEVSITNTEKTFSISVSKSLVDEENKELSADDIAEIPAAVSKNFKANITLNDADGNPVNGTFTSGTTTVEFVDGVYTATITAGSSAFTISGIPYGYTYKVEEVTATDFDSEHFSYESGNVPDFKEATLDTETGKLGPEAVTIKNEYIPDVPGSITVYKSYLAQDTEEATFYFALFTDANGSERAALVSNPQAFYPVKHITLTGDPEEAVSGIVE
ncbi:MAG: hypothetical protein K5848_00075, partial [Lachnospiraceae bacterium]|nr:hypothetical protein [Lachnospiraceae bacterium]